MFSFWGRNEVFLLGISKKLLESNTFIAFLKDGLNRELYIRYLNDGNEENAKKLDAAYKKFEQIVIIGAYLKKVIYYEAKRFDRKIREFEKMNRSIDENIGEGGTLKDTLMDENNVINLNEIENSLEEIFENKKLYEAIVNLTKKQRHVIFLLYIKKISEKEVAVSRGVTQQAISKTHRSCIKKLREMVERC